MPSDLSFGSAKKYYARNQLAGTERPARTTPSALERMFRDLLYHHMSDLHDRVARSCKRWNLTLREQVRNETGLRLSKDDARQTVPVRVLDGLPEPFAEILGGMEDPILLELILKKPLLSNSLPGLDFVNANYANVEKYLFARTHVPDKLNIENTLELFQILMSEIEKEELISKIRAIDQDILGAYFFYVPEIQIYWMVIGFFAGMLNVAVEDLTLVVLLHELAHAYTHLGLDIDGMSWQTESFARADLRIVEGPAQFYTAEICEKLSGGYPWISAVFQKILAVQSEPYQVYKEWYGNTEMAGEIVRLGLIECRSNGITEYARLLSALEEARPRIGKRRK